MSNIINLTPGSRTVPRKVVNIPLEPWMDVNYEAKLRIQAAELELTLWQIRRVDLIFGWSPYCDIPREDLPAEHFGIIQ